MMKGVEIMVETLGSSETGQMVQPLFHGEIGDTGKSSLWFALVNFLFFFDSR